MMTPLDETLRTFDDLIRSGRCGMRVVRIMAAGS